MTNAEQDQLFAALRGPEILNDEEDARLANAVAWDDVERATPAVDAMLRNAEARGRFRQLLEDADMILRKEMA